MTKVYVSVDIEGIAGVVHWDQAMPSGPEYGLGQRLLMEELRSVLRGAEIAGARDITVNDSHGAMRNVTPDLLGGRVRIITGHFKPMYMMEGLDASFDAAIFLGYHGPAGAASVLSHSYNPRVIWEARLNGAVTGETGINALVAHHYRVPVVMITGDDVTVEDAARWIPEALGIVVKRSIGRFSADSMSPLDAVSLIFEQAQRALSAIPECPKRRETSISLELTLQSAEMALLAEWGGARRTAERTVVIEGRTGLEVYQRFHTVLILARAVTEA